MNEEFLAKEKIPKLLLKMSAPAIVAMFVNAMYNFVDRIFVGKIDKLALSAVGISMPIQIVIMAFMLMIGVGSSICISICLGKKDKEKAEQILSQAFWMLGIILTIICSLFYVFRYEVLIWLNCSKEVMPYAKDYIEIILLGSILGLWGFGMNNCLRSQGDAKFSMYILVFSAILNIILDPIFIFVLNMGIKGAAVATVISEIFVMVMITGYFLLSKKSVLKLKIFNFKFDKIQIIKIFKNGFPVFLMQLVATLILGVLNKNLIIYGSDEALSAMTIIMGVFQVYHMIIVGIMQGSQPIIGFNFGASYFKRVLEILNLTVLVSTFFSIITWLSIMVFAKYIIMWFTNDIHLIELTLKGMRIYLACLPLIGIQFVLAQYFQAVEKTKIATIVLLLRFGIILYPLLYILPKFYKLDGIWYSGMISDFISFIVVFILFIFEKKDLKKKIFK